MVKRSPGDTESGVVTISAQGMRWLASASTVAITLLFDDSPTALTRCLFPTAAVKGTWNSSSNLPRLSASASSN